MTQKLTGKRVRRPSLSASVRRGLDAIASSYRVETDDELAAVAWMRRMLAALQSRQRQPHDAGAHSSPVAPRSGGD